MNFSPITVYANKSRENKDCVPINSIRCQNVTIRRKNKKNICSEKIVNEGDKEILLEVGYILVSERICLVEGYYNNVEVLDGAPRAHNPSV